MACLLLTGAYGRLGREILKYCETAGIRTIAPIRALDVRNREHCLLMTDGIPGNTVVIHAAAVADTVECEKFPEPAWHTNVGGAVNMLEAAQRNAHRFVYISTDYVFDGEQQGGYAEWHWPKPVNVYGQTKRAAELAVLHDPTSLVLRAPFRSRPWRYENAFADQFTSCLWAEQQAPRIVHAALSKVAGIVHLPAPRRSVLDLAREDRPEIEASSMAEWSAASGIMLPRDVSLITVRNWELHL